MKNIVSPRLGMGCWAIGGPFWFGDEPWGYANADDAQSLATLEAAYDGGVRVYDTAAVYGCGHSEKLLGQAFKSHDDVVIVTKFGVGFDEDTKQVVGPDTDPKAVRPALDASRKRLGRDVLDLVFLHLNAITPQVAAPLFDALEEARFDGIIDTFGWSTDFPASARSALHRDGFVAVQHAMNLFFDAPSMMEVAHTHELASFNRSPLAMGLLTGKFNDGAHLPANDIRQNSYDWMDYFKDGKIVPIFVAKIEALRELITVDGRSLAQGALCWLLAKSPATVPIPGARTPEQAAHNAKAIEFGPLPKAIMDEIESVLARPPEGTPRER
ncbi:MAG: aldo/keto reductase [Devosiaceae bacterium]